MATMINLTEDKTMTNTKVKAEAKARVMEIIINALIEEFGEENVCWVRTGNGQSKTKELAVRIGDVTVGDDVYELCTTVNASAKDYRERTGNKGQTYPAFEFNVMREEYEIYLEEKEAKAKDSKAKKEKKIAADKKARAKKAAEEGIVDF